MQRVWVEWHLKKIASQGGFVCVMDFALPELGNLLAGSVVNAVDDRLTNVGRAGVPQMVAPERRRACARPRRPKRVY